MPSTDPAVDALKDASIGRGVQRKDEVGETVIAKTMPELGTGCQLLPTVGSLEDGRDLGRKTETEEFEDVERARHDRIDGQCPGQAVPTNTGLAGNQLAVPSMLL